MKHLWKKLSLKGKLFILFIGCIGVLIATHLFERLKPRVSKHILSNTPEQVCDLKKPISIGAFNIAHGRGDGSSKKNQTDESKEERMERLEQIHALIKKNPPTFLILNECNFETYWSHDVFQPKYISGDLYRYAITQSNYQARLLTRSWNFGNVILCNQQPEKVELIEFEPLKSYEALIAGNHDGLLAYFKDKHGSPFRILAVHLEVRSEETRLLAAKKILEIEKQEDSPLIVAGDFNSTLETMPYHKTTGEGPSAIDFLLDNTPFKTAIPDTALHATFSTKDPHRRLDWILIPNNWKTLRFRTELTPLSDHGYIRAQIKSP